MSDTPVSDNELKSAIVAVFGEVPQDDLQQRVDALCQGMYEDSEVDVDSEWFERFYPQYERWINRLRALELDYQQRIALFLQHCQQETEEVPELLDELAQTRMDRTWGGVTEYFESVMPNEFLTASRADFFVDVGSQIAWWTASDGEPGVDLQTALGECLAVAGEFQADSVRHLTPVFIEALCDGTAPLPGFEFQQARDGIAVWEWVSTEEESGKAAPQPASTEFSIFMEDRALNLWETVPVAARLLQMSGCRPLPLDAAASIPVLVSRFAQRGVSRDDILREIGTPLIIASYQASQTGNVVQLQLATEAIASLSSKLQDHTADLTAE